MKHSSQPHVDLFQRGFTLVEMAVVVVLMGIVLALGLRLLQATQLNAAVSETKLKQEKVKIALIGYLRSNKNLPCPDRDMHPDGTEDTPCNGANNGRGVLPWRQMGLSMGDVQDGWGNFFTYRVANGSGGSGNWTSSGPPGPAGFTIMELTTPTSNLTLNERVQGTPGGVALTPNPVVVLLSHGKNGYGARSLSRNSIIPTGGAGADELTNATQNTTAFFMGNLTEVSTATGGAFDDIVAFMTALDLLQPLVNEKTIRQCAAYCPAPPATCPASGQCNASNVPIGRANFNGCTCVPGQTRPQ